MPFQAFIIRRLRMGPAIVALGALCLGLAVPTASLADSGPIKLALTPIGQAGSFFDLTMAAGQARTLSVEIANNGAAAVTASTYLADVYTIIDRGFGARLRGQAGTGTTTWISYPAEVLQLAPGQSIQRAFTVTIPAGTGAGEYISSLVLENAEPTPASGAVGINQVVRQAVAVVVTVPGPRLPGLAIGASTANVVNGTSTISVAVQNTGNVRLKPAVGFTLTDSTGAVINHATIQMDTFYAETSTTVEVPIGVLLEPGRYIVALTLDDPSQGAQAAARGVLVVGRPLGSATSAAGSAGAAARGDAGPPLPIAGFVLVSAVVLALGGAVAVRRRHARQAAHSG